MSAKSRKIAESVFDKLWIGIIVAIATSSATFATNFILEKYKINSTINVYDSNEFIKRVDLLWAKAYEFDADAHDLGLLYDDANRTEFFNELFPMTPKKNYEDVIEQKRSAMYAKLGEFFDLLRKSQFYLGDAVVGRVLQYVIWANIIAHDQEIEFTVRKKDDKSLLAQVQEIAEKERMQEAIDKRRQEKSKLFELTREEMSKLRFDYTTARHYSLK